MNSSDSSDDDCSFGHWNKWTPKEMIAEKNEPENIYVEKNVPVNEFRTRITSKPDDDKFGNWIPPNNWTDKKMKVLKKDNPRKASNDHKSKQELSVATCSSLTSQTTLTTSLQTLDALSPNFNPINNHLNWNDRRDFTDLSNLSEKTKVWNIVDPGIFHKINLWCNQYGFICGTAQGKIYSKRGCKEGAILIIDKPDILRKLLGVSQPKWASLCDSVKSNNANLNYDAFNNYEILKLNCLERLWMLLCKRRQLVPSVCVQFCLNGAMKIMKEFQILPKLIVQDIYDLQGKDL